MIELLSPAGNIEKLDTAYRFGADACYTGMTKFSLRKNADNIKADEVGKLGEIKKRYGKRLYCTMNIMFHEDSIDSLVSEIKDIDNYPFDAFIITDLGLVPILQKYCPDKELHLSTQASCLNSSAAKLYHDMGFTRVILGRETPLDDIRRIKDRVPELQLETFVHGAMCMAYSGRCLLSAFLSGRSANQGDCAHTCRWKYRLALEEESRPGLYFPIDEEDDYTTILSSKDMCMIDHLDDLREAGIDSLKIEGRMKSQYYVAVVTRAYRKALDNDPEWRKYREDLFNISHREYSTGFFYSSDPVDSMKTMTSESYIRDYMFLGSIKDEVRPGIWSLDLRNQIRKGQTIEYIGEDILSLSDDTFTLLDENFEEVDQIDHGKIQYLKTDRPVETGYIIRRENS